MLSLTVVQLDLGCSPEDLVGMWSCGDVTGASNAATDAGPSDGGSSDAGSSPITIPWSSGFEDGFCGYAAAAGFCYTFDGSFRIVDSPVHSGYFAAAFDVDSSHDGGAQARCFREGSLPRQASYGAWYFIPSAHTNKGNWNLFHFQGGTRGSRRLPGLWDVSLTNDANGDLKLSILDFLASFDTGTSAAPPVPIGSWFHIQFYLRRAADATGEVTLYQDGVVAFHLVNIVTDNTTFGQWYVGNLADQDALTPSQSTIYVDDVEITETP